MRVERFSMPACAALVPYAARPRLGIMPGEPAYCNMLNIVCQCNMLPVCAGFSAGGASTAAATKQLQEQLQEKLQEKLQKQPSPPKGMA